MNRSDNPYEAPRATESKQRAGTPPPSSASWYLVFTLGPAVAALMFAATYGVLLWVRTWR